MERTTRTETNMVTTVRMARASTSQPLQGGFSTGGGAREPIPGRASTCASEIGEATGSEIGLCGEDKETRGLPFILTLHQRRCRHQVVDFCALRGVPLPLKKCASAWP